VTLKQFLKMVATQFKTTVKGVRTDNGGEFVNGFLQVMFKELGIIHYKTCAHTPQQNGVATFSYSRGRSRYEVFFWKETLSYSSQNTWLLMFCKYIA